MCGAALRSLRLPFRFQSIAHSHIRAFVVAEKFDATAQSTNSEQCTHSGGGHGRKSTGTTCDDGTVYHRTKENKIQKNSKDNKLQWGDINNKGKFPRSVVASAVRSYNCFPSRLTQIKHHLRRARRRRGLSTMTPGAQLVSWSGLLSRRLAG